MHAGRVEKRVDLGFTEDLGKAFLAARSADLDSGIVLAPAFFEGKAVKLLDGRKPPGAGRGGKSLRVAMNEIGLDIAARGGFERSAAPVEPAGEVGEIPRISQLSVLRGVKFGRLRLEKGADTCGGCHPRRSNTRSSSAARRAAVSSPRWRR